MQGMVLGGELKGVTHGNGVIDLIVSHEFSSFEDDGVIAMIANQIRLVRDDYHCAVAAFME